MTSVARLMPSTSDSRQPYRLSNFDLVTESLTLIAGKPSRPSLCICVQALHARRRFLGDAADVGLDPRIESGVLARGASRSRRTARTPPRCPDAKSRAIGLGLRAEMDQQRRVAAIVENHVRCGAGAPLGSGHSKVRCVNSQYSASVSPLCANTGVPRAAIAAAAWSCVE